MAAHIRNLSFWKKSYFKEGSVIVATGAGSGICRAVCLKYGTRDCKFVLADINMQGLEETKAMLENMGKEVVIVQCNVTKEADCKRLMDTALERFGAIDQLLLCAGIGAHHFFPDTQDLSIFKKLMNVNFYGYLNCVKHAYDALCRSKGVLVAVTSFSGEVGLPHRTAYCASKFAVTGFLEALRSEMSAYPTRRTADGLETNNVFDVTIVCPPTINTNLRANSITPDPKLREAGTNTSKSMTVEDCADAIVDAGDRRLRKAFFPLKSFLASYMRPLLPDFVDQQIRARASL